MNWLHDSEKEILDSLSDSTNSENLTQNLSLEDELNVFLIEDIRKVLKTH
jgi:hypothetical protein